MTEQEIGKNAPEPQPVHASLNMSHVEESAAWMRLAGTEAPDRDGDYYSCQSLERGMVFYPNKITACCTRHSDGVRGEPVLVEYSGGPLPVEQLLSERKRILESHKKGDIHPECRSCPNLKKRSWDYERWLIDMITVAHYTHCNLKCDYCYTVREPSLLVKPRDNYKLLPVFQELINLGLLAPYAEIRFAGGEPVMLKEFKQIVPLVTEYGCLARVYTNAVLRSEAIIDALKKNRASLVLGIDAGSREAYMRVKGRDEVERAWKNAAEYVSIDSSNVWAKMIVRHDNTDDIDAFVARCVLAGVKRVYYDMDMYAHELPLFIETVITAIARLKLECAKHGIETMCGEAGAQNLDYMDVVERIESRLIELAKADEDGLAFLASRRLREEIGLDVSLYEKAGSTFGPAYIDAAKVVLAGLMSVS